MRPLRHKLSVPIFDLVTFPVSLARDLKMLLAAGNEGVRLLDLENPDVVHRLKERGVEAVAFWGEGRSGARIAIAAARCGAPA